jgi:amino acid transporter
MSFFSRLLKRPVHFVESKVDQVKDDVRKEIADGLAPVTMIVAMAVLSLIVIFFLSAGMALYLNVVLETTFGGFLIVGGFYVLLLGILIYLRNNEDFMNKLKVRYRREMGVKEEYEEEVIELLEDYHR